MFIEFPLSMTLSLYPPRFWRRVRNRDGEEFRPGMKNGRLVNTNWKSPRVSRD